MDLCFPCKLIDFNILLMNAHSVYQIMSVNIKNIGKIILIILGKYLTLPIGTLENNLKICILFRPAVLYRKSFIPMEIDKRKCYSK